MGFIKKILNQTRKPEGFLGKIMVNNMNSGHAALSDWGMSHLENITPEEISIKGSDTLSQLFVNCFWLEKSLLIQVELRKPFTDGRNIKLDVVAHYANTY